MTDEQLRVGVIGAGGISHAHVPAWLGLGAEVRIYSVEGAETVAKHYGVGTVDTLSALLEWSEVVDIVTPTPSHTELALAAIEQGTPVICEKPLARTVADAERMRDSAADAGVMLFPAHVVRYFPEYVAARKAIQSGRIGRPAVARFRRQSSAPQSDWFFDVEQSGGLVMDQMIHDLDQAEWLLGRVESVFARMRSGGSDAPRIASAHVILTHASGAISVVSGTWGGDELPFSYSFDISGDAGVLRFDSARDDSRRVSVAVGGAGGYLPDFDTARSPYRLELEDAVRAMQTGASPGVTAQDGVRAVELAEAALESMRTGLAVRTHAVTPHPPADANSEPARQELSQ